MGGGVMRSAAKVASGSIRGFTADHHPLSSVVRRSVSLRPAASATEDVKLVASNSEVIGTRSGSEFEDWVFAGEEEASGDLIPRVVFGGVPTRQEAEEATSELSAAWERAHASSVCEGGESVIDRDFARLSLSNTQHLDPLTALPAPAVMAFRFLSENPAAKNVVASVACDPNVWNAVLQNQEFQGYLASQGASLSTPGVNLEADSVSDDALPNQSETASENYPPEADEHTNTSNEDFFQKIKNAVVGMMNAFSDYFKNLFGGKASDPDAHGSSPIYDEAMKIFGLAVVVVSLIVLKRAF